MLNPTSKSFQVDSTEAKVVFPRPRETNQRIVEKKGASDRSLKIPEPDSAVTNKLD